ncbi:Uu.00g039670.m01.CDS01 [Anthostomella pinea]|uniref:pyridoxal kinase n=1 Tax=Anthostomella pinea TaxID=933095 RepID=A0AAI8V9X4_9PEZI|nr:Uu.00g039670.m01.CDS01 [Anthostomella pinea]
MSPELPVPETGVLAVASHVVSGHVGNKIAVFVLQSMGCDVSALNTVQFSNHTGYRQFKGMRVSAQEITDLWEGLKQSHLDNFDLMLSGYVPGAAAVEAVGRIAKELKADAATRPGSFFWVLDPVMGDNGKIYVAEDVVPAYQDLIHHADLILPNQFEAELLSGVKITDSATLERAIEVLHEKYNLPHIVITSVSFPLSASQAPSLAGSRAHSPAPAAPGSPQQSRAPQTRTMSVVGSTRTSDRRPRLFKIHFPVFDCYFSGTGDMFAALMVVRMREAVCNNGGGPEGGVLNTESWLSPDGVDALDLPLAHAAEKVLASMHEVLARTCEAMPKEMEAAVARLRRKGGVGQNGAQQEGKNGEELDEKTLHLLRSRAAELNLSRNLACLRDPTVAYRAEKM